MNLRTISIWTTAVMWLLTVVLLTLSFFYDLPKDNLDESITMVIKGLPIVFMFSGCPLIGSLIITVSLKYRMPILMLFVSTIVYGFLYILIAFIIFSVRVGDVCGMLLNVGILSLPIMIPVWIIALVIDYHKKNPLTPSEP